MLQKTGFPFGTGDVITIEVKGDQMYFKKNGTDTNISLTGWSSMKVYPVVTLKYSEITLLPNNAC